MRPLKKRFVPGDLVLVEFPDCGYWPCQITAILKHGKRQVKCFGEDRTGKALTKNMVYYNQNTKAKYISESTFKTYPHLAEALKQIEIYKANALNKSMKNKNSKQKKGTLKEIAIGNSDKIDNCEDSGIRCQNQNTKEANSDIEEQEEMVEGDDSEITCVGVSGSVVFIRRMALGEKEMTLSVKIENAAAMEPGSCQWGEAIKRENNNEGTEGDINVDATGTGNHDEFDLKIKVELDSDVGDFGLDETDAIEAESQNNSNLNVQSNSSESTNDMSMTNAASYEDDSDSGAKEERFTEARASRGKDPAVQPPVSSPQGGDPENQNEVVKVTIACEMPLNVFEKFAPMLMEAASHSQAPPVVNIYKQ